MLPAPGLYVHLPWCVKKCPYCDFNSHAVKDTPPYAEYADAVCADLKHQIGKWSPDAFGSVFLGGGTPSLFSPDHIGRILDTASRSAGIRSNAEITLEANPGAIEHGSFAGYRRAGVNRISLGVQSFGEHQLKALGRVHSADEAHRAIESIQGAGFEQVNIDLMYGLPDQNPDMALEDIETAIGLGPTHLSHYQLTIEPNTLFAVKTPQLPDSEECFDMQQQCQQRLASAGFRQYEVSAYAKTGCAGQHNLNYWRYGDYLGVGAGAHGKITLDARSSRTQKPKHPAQYLRDPLEMTIVESSPSEHLFEFMLNRLRLNEPIDKNEMESLWWLANPESLARFRLAEERGLMICDTAGAWSRSPLGERFLNDLQEIFLP